LAGTNHSSFYALPTSLCLDEEEARLLELIDQEYTRHPFYGSRKLKWYFAGLGNKIIRKRAQRLMIKRGSAFPLHKQTVTNLNSPLFVFWEGFHFTISINIICHGS
jgi:hypothetical protein